MPDYFGPIVPSAAVQSLRKLSQPRSSQPTTITIRRASTVLWRMVQPEGTPALPTMRKRRASTLSFGKSGFCPRSRAPSVALTYGENRSDHRRLSAIQSRSKPSVHEVIWHVDQDVLPNKDQRPSISEDDFSWSWDEGERRTESSSRLSFPPLLERDTTGDWTRMPLVDINDPSAGRRIAVEPLHSNAPTVVEGRDQKITERLGLDDWRKWAAGQRGQDNLRKSSSSSHAVRTPYWGGSESFQRERWRRSLGSALSA